MERKLYNLMNWPMIEEITYSECDNPHKLLGACVYKEGILIQIFRPDAVEVTVRVDGKKKEYVCEKVDESGYFAVLIPGKKMVSYEVTVENPAGKKTTYIDPYQFQQAISPQIYKKILCAECYDEYKYLGAHRTTVDNIEGISFLVWAPNAMRVSLVGDFNNWDGRIHQMRRDCESGLFDLFVPGLSAGTKYKYEIKDKGGKIYLKTDPFCSECSEEDGFASIVAGEDEFDWTDSKWTGNKKKSGEIISILELNPGDFETLEDILEAVSQAKENGFTHIELTSVAMRDGKNANEDEILAYFCVDSGCKGSKGLKRIVDRCHNEGIGVIADWSAAFMAKGRNGLTWFDGINEFETSTLRIDARKELSVASFNLNKPFVRTFLISNALMWAKEYHIDGLKVNNLDSLLYLDYGRKPGEWIPNIYGGNENLDAVTLFKDLKKQIKKAGLDTILIAQDYSCFSNVTGDAEDSLSFDFKWNNGWASDIKAIIELDPLFRKGMYERLTDEMLYHYRENFILEFSKKDYSSLNDLLGRMSVSKEEQLANLRMAIAYMYMYPGKKLVNHELVSKLEPSFMEGLGAFYREHRSLYELDQDERGFLWIDTNHMDETVTAFMRSSEDDREKLLVITNFTPVLRKDFKTGVNLYGKYKEVFNTDASAYGGNSKLDDREIFAEEEKINGWEYSISITLPPLSVIVLEYSEYNRYELEEIEIRGEAKKAKEAAVQQAAYAQQLKINADEEARKALEAERLAKEAARAALEAQNRARETAKEALKAKEIAEERAKAAFELQVKIEEEMEEKLKALYRKWKKEK